MSLRSAYSMDGHWAVLMVSVDSQCEMKCEIHKPCKQSIQMYSIHMISLLLSTIFSVKNVFPFYRQITLLLVHI